MAINTWRSPENEAYMRTRKAVRAESQRLEEEERKRREREELWDGFDAGALLAEAMEAQERARELKRAHDLKREIQTQVLITEVEEEVKRSSEK